MNPFSHTGLSISDSLKSVRKSVLIYEAIIGTIENHNGLIRRFLPKGKRVDSYDEDTILGVELWANGLPRKILGYRTPDEAFEAEMDRLFAV